MYAARFCGGFRRVFSVCQSVFHLAIEREMEDGGERVGLVVESQLWVRSIFQKYVDTHPESLSAWLDYT